MLFVRTSVLCALAALLLAACGERTDAPQPTRVTAGEAAEGAALLGLEEPGRASWEERSFSGGIYRFTGFSLVLDEAGELVITADAMEIAAPRLEDGIVRFDRLVLENGTLPSEDVAEARFERLVIDRPGPELSRSVAASFTGEEAALPDLAGNLDAYSFRELSLTGFSLSGGEFDGVMQAGAIILEQLDADGLESARIEGLRMESHGDEPLELAIEQARIDGAGARFIAALVAGEAANPLNLAVSANPADFYRALRLDGLAGTASGLAFAMETFRVDVSDVREGTRTRIHMPELTLSAQRDSDAGAQIEGALAFLGYEDVVLSLESDSIYDPASDTARTQNTNRFIWRDGLTLDFRQEISGVAAYGEAVAAAQAAGKTGDAVMEGLDRHLLLHSFEMRLEDQSLLERSFTAYGAMLGMNPAQARLQASALVTLGLSAAPREVPRSFLNAIAMPLSEFVRDGGSLVLTLDPPSPVPMNTLTSPSGDFDIDRLGLSVRVERAN